jgi:predicted nucleotidyltransferase
MRKSVLPPDYRTRDVLAGCLRELRPRLEVEGVRHVALFGSVARGDDVPESDVDLVLDLDPEKHIGLFELVDIVAFLEEALGRRVDVATRASLRRRHHDEILADLHEVF